MDFPLWAMSLVNGLIGGVIYVFVQRLGWKDDYEILRRLILAIVAGYLTHLLGHMDPVTTLLAGYFGLDVVEALINSRKPKEQ